MVRTLFVFLLLSVNLCAKVGADSILTIGNLPYYQSEASAEPALTLSGPWRFMKGDQPQWADSSFDDSGWVVTNSNLDTLSKAPGFFGGIGWFRTRVNVAPEYADKPLAIMITQSGASEIYVDGEKIHSFGTIDVNNPANEDRFDPQLVPVDVLFKNSGLHVIAVRYADARAEEDVASGVNYAPGFLMKVGIMRSYSVYRFVNSNILTAVFVFYFTFFIALAFLHLIMFLYYKSNKSNLYYSIFAGSFGLIFFCMLVRTNLMSPDSTLTAELINQRLSDIYGPALIAMLYTIFYGRLLKIFWVWLGIFALDFIFTTFDITVPYFSILTFCLFCIESVRVIVVAIWKKRDGAWTIGSGVIITAFFLLGFTFLAAIGKADMVMNARGLTGLVVGMTAIYFTLSIPLHMSVYLAKDFARTNRSLKKKLAEVEELSQKSVAQEKEKQKILAEQNDMLETQVKERTFEINEQKKVIEEKNKDITDSIHYAKKIQEAMLPAIELVDHLFPKNFILYKPKDIVSGDFYWVADHSALRFIAAVDCTGHGVPGALMSMTGNNFLNQLVVERNVLSPREILEGLDGAVRKSLRQDRAETESKDGMDIALCRFSSDFRSLVYAGANRPLWVVRNKELIEYKPVKQSIGGSDANTGLRFSEVEVALQRGDCIYIFSDGYADQFGGPEGKKFMSRKLKELLCEISMESPAEQKRMLEDSFAGWMGGLTQVDDVLIIGIRV